MSFLLDTHVGSEIRRGRDPQVRGWADAVDDLELHLSVMTLGEIRTGIGRLRGHDAEQRGRFLGRIRPVDARVADRWVDWMPLRAATRSTA